MSEMKLEIEGKDVSLSPLTLNDLIALEGKIGKKLTTLKNEDFGMGDVRFVIWLSVKKQLSDVTEEQVGEALVMGSTKLDELQRYLLGGAGSKNLPTG